MRLVFMGTPEFAATILEELVQHHEVVAVYTRPDAIRGRGKTLVASPVKILAEALELPVLTPKTLKDTEVQTELSSFAPDAICVAAYGALLPKAILDIPRYGCLNVHGSLLPAWRGAAPVERTILAGDQKTGVCVMRMEEGLDTGDYCVCRTTNVGNKTVAELSDELANLGAHALLTALIHLQEGALDWTKQDEAFVSYAPKIEKSELNLNYADSAVQALAKLRASSPQHPSRCCIAKRSLTLVKLADINHNSSAQELTKQMQPGDVFYKEKRLFLRLSDAAVEVVEIKPDGKQVMSAQAFAVGVSDLQSGTSIWEVLHV